jgi:hypothetical protein
MSDDIGVDTETLRGHASNLMQIHGRFDAIREASGHISQADDAYGQLCQFFPAILEGRHQEQDAAVAVLAENIQALSEAVNDCAEAYDEADSVTADDFSGLESELGG